MISPTAPALISARISSRVTKPSCSSGALVAQMADADEGDIGLTGQIDHMLHRLLRQQQLLLVPACWR